MSQKLHVKTGDTVVVISGKDKGKQGKIKAAMPKDGRVVVEGINMIKRHTKPTQANPKGGIIEKEAFKTYRILQRQTLEKLAFID